MDLIGDFFSGLTGIATSVWTDITEVFITSFDSVYEFWSLLVDQNIVMQDMIDQITAGNTFDGVNLVTYIGAYRYLAGEILFTYTYLLIIVGAGFMIYKLIMAIINFIKNLLSGANLGSMFRTGKLFKYK